MLNKEYYIKIAKMYYEEQMTQNEIAKVLNVSRISISRAIKKCIEEGIVEIKINYDDAYDDLEVKLRKKYNSVDFKIVPYDKNSLSLSKLMGKAIGELIYTIMKNNKIIGIGWGKTLSEIDLSSYDHIKTDNTFVSLLGGYGNITYSAHANQMVLKLAEKFSCSSVFLYAPAIVESVSLKEKILEDSSIKNTFDFYKNLDSVIIGLGNPMCETSTIYESGYFEKKDLEEIQKANICLDIASSIYIDKNGNEVNLNLVDRTIGISKEDFKKVPYKVIVAGGENKMISVKLAIENGYANLVITDEKTAKYLLKN